MAKQSRLVKTKSGGIRTNKNMIKKPKAFKPIKPYKGPKK